MSHFSPTSLPTVKTMLASNAYQKIDDNGRLEADLNLSNTLILKDTIEKGYYEYIKYQEQNHLEKVNLLSSINNSLLNYQEEHNARLNALLAQQELTNSTLKSIKESLNTPDFERKRIFQYNQGLKFLKQAQINPKRYDNALCSFLNAEEINSDDYIVLYHIGLIYLHSSNNLDLEAAEEYLTRSLSLIDGLNDKVEDDCKYQLGYCYFIQTKFNKALKSLSVVKNINYDIITLIIKCNLFLNRDAKVHQLINKLNYKFLIQLNHNYYDEGSDIVKKIYNLRLINSEKIGRENYEEISYYNSLISLNSEYGSSDSESYKERLDDCFEVLVKASEGNVDDWFVLHHLTKHEDYLPSFKNFVNKLKTSPDFIYNSGITIPFWLEKVIRTSLALGVLFLFFKFVLPFIINF